MAERRIKYLHKEIAHLKIMIKTTKTSVKDLHDEIERLQAELKALTYVNIVCAECGSDDMLINAAVRWNTEKQNYDVWNVFDGGHDCGDCGHPCDIKEVPA